MNILDDEKIRLCIISSELKKVILSYPEIVNVEKRLTIYAIETMLGPVNHLDFAIRPNAVGIFTFFSVR